MNCRRCGSDTELKKYHKTKKSIWEKRQIITLGGSGKPQTKVINIKRKIKSAIPKFRYVCKDCKRRRRWR